MAIPSGLLMSLLCILGGDGSGTCDDMAADASLLRETISLPTEGILYLEIYNLNDTQTLMQISDNMYWLLKYFRNYY